MQSHLGIRQIIYCDCKCVLVLISSFHSTFHSNLFSIAFISFSLFFLTFPWILSMPTCFSILSLIPSLVPVVPSLPYLYLSLEICPLCVLLKTSVLFSPAPSSLPQNLPSYPWNSPRIPYCCPSWRSKDTWGRKAEAFLLAFKVKPACASVSEFMKSENFMELII